MMKNEVVSDPDLIKRKTQALISSHFMLSTKSQTIPSQRSCMYFPEFKIKRKKKEKQNHTSPDGFSFIGLMYNIDKLNKDQLFCYFNNGYINLNSEIYNLT